MTESPFEDLGTDTPDEVAANAATSPEGEPVAEPVVELTREQELEAAVAALTSDLQRKQAEFINYKRRVEDDRIKFIADGKATVINSLLTVLDDLGRADQHGELVGGFKAVADSLRTVVSGHGLEEFGEAGEAFDPNFHEAVSHAGESADVSVTSLAQVLRTGFRIGDKVIRPATVIVVDPASTAPEAAAEPASETE
ncbi:MAG: nucleotide exchange factor GrpE [Actinomycetales bacterium]|nr:nucleotide exchange factor GrpE [Actinomycetales bacterium]